MKYAKVDQINISVKTRFQISNKCRVQKINETYKFDTEHDFSNFRIRVCHTNMKVISIWYFQRKFIVSASIMLQSSLFPAYELVLRSIELLVSLNIF